MSISLLSIFRNFNNNIIIKIAVMILLLLILFFLSLIPAFAADNLNRPQLTEQERWVLSQVKEGREADLQSKFGSLARMRLLRGIFLEKLISGSFDHFQVSCRGIKIAHAIIADPIDLEYIEVNYPLSLSHCLFEKAATFQESHYKKDFILNGSTFLQSANFKGIKIDGNVFCNDAIFEQESVWSDAKIGENFNIIRAKFNHSDAKADFSAMKVGSNAFFTSAIFNGPADFGLLHVGRQFNINKAEFFNKEAIINFISATVEQIAYLKEVRFHGPVDFAIAQIGMQFNADDAEFLSRYKKANFSGIKVGNTIYFQRAKFYGPVKFEFAEIGVNFRGSDIEFLNQDDIINFSKMKVSQKVFLDNAILRGVLDMSYSNFYDLDMRGAIRPENGENYPHESLAQLILKDTTVQRELKIADITVADLDADNLQVKGPAEFSHVAVNNRASFRSSVFQSLNFKDIQWPDKDNATNIRQVYLNDMTYSSISINKSTQVDYVEKNFLEIMDFLENSPFNTQSYIQLEAFFKRIGRETWSNKVFIHMHDRDLAEKMAWWDPRRWLEWFFWGMLAGYGRAPFRVIFISLFLIVIGALIYDPEYLQADMRPIGEKPYQSMIMRCFLSLDRFLPVDLGLGKQWNSQTRHFLIWLYFYLELILGWILIPIALASIYTQIK
jgi:uncharacterized protein YjbI with pentapeptide repeats